MEEKEKLSELREKAQKFLEDNANKKKFKSFEEIEKLVEELNVSQIELEMQNKELREANYNLQNEREKYRSLFFDAPLAYITVNKTGNIIHINKQAANMLGLHAAQFKYTSLFPYLKEDSKPAFIHFFKKIFKSETVKINDVVFIDVNKKYVYAKLQAKVFFDSQLNDKLCRLTITDISSEKKRIRQAEEKFTRLFESLSDPVYIHDFNEKMILVNRTAGKILGYTHEELAERKISDIEFKDNKELIQNRFEQLEAEGKAVFETVHQTKNGKKLPVEVHAKVIDFENRKAILSIARDIKKRKKDEAALKESEQKFRKLFDSVNDAIFIHPEKEQGFGKFTEMNRTACERYGYTREELLQMSPADLTEFQSHFELSDKKKRHHLLEKKNTFEAVQLNKSGKRIPVEISTAVIELNGKPHLQSVVRDITERKLAEKRIKYSEAKFHSIFDCSPQAMALTEADTGKITEVNDAFCRKVGLSKKELIGTTTIQNKFFTPKKRKTFMAELKQKSAVKDFEITYTNPKGEKYTAIMNANFIEIESKMYILTMFMDITEKRRLEEKLLYSAGVIKAALESSNDAFFIFDKQKRIIEFNKNAQKYVNTLWGKNIKRNDSFLDFEGPENLKKSFVKNFEKALSGKTVINEQLIKINKNEIWFRTVLTPVVYDNNKTIGISFNAHDITKRKKLEIKQTEYNAELQTLNEELQTSMEQLHKTKQKIEIERNQFIELLDSIPENIYVACKDTHQIIFANKHLKKRLGSNIEGEKCYKVLRNFNNPCSFCTNPIIFSQKKPYYWNNFNEKDKRHYYQIDRAIKWTDGRDARFQLAIDITKLKEYEKQLEELNATKDKFFSIVSHDLRSPFNSLLGLSDFLVKKIEKLDKNRIRKITESINQASVKAYKLIENLLEWSRAQTGRIEFAPENIKLKNLCSEIIMLSDMQANEKNIKLKMEVDNQIIVNADRNMTNTILRNLLSNAVKFTPKNGEVILAAQQKNNTALLSVTDNGVGMPQEKISKLFNISEKTSSLGTEKEQGTGLGLLLCNEFVQKHGSKITVKSTEGEGSRFSFELPLIKPEK